MSGDYSIDHINARLDALEASSPARQNSTRPTVTPCPNGFAPAPAPAPMASAQDESAAVAACPNGFTLPQCPFKQEAAAPPATGPELNLRILKGKSHNNPTSYCYPSEFAKCDLEALKQDLYQVMTTSQPWWPADYGHYGPLFVRMAWHSAGTYRIADGRGGANTGNQRFAPLNSWPDNGNLDKARRLLWPIKKKYGRKISWADLMIYAGNCAMEHMGCPQFGFAGGREDIWEPEDDIWWGPEAESLADQRHPDADHPEKIMEPLGAVQMGLIYVNPQGPGGNPDVLASGRDIRETFALMAMNDEETVALIAGGHTFGKAHGAGSDTYVGPDPEAEGIEAQGFGWKNSMGSGKGVDTITSGLEGAWTANPVQWDNGYFHNLFEYEFELVKGAGGAKQWAPKDGAAADAIPDAHDSSKKHAPMMFTTDLALRYDERYAPISKRFYENPDQFHLAYTKAWYKLCHRDMGPHSRCLGALVPPAQIWQDPVPTGTPNAPLLDDLGNKLLGCGLSPEQLIRTAWASACTFRKTDFRGGANGARLALAPQNEWVVNDPAELAHVLETLQRAGEGSGVSMADLIVLGGTFAVKEAAKKADFSPTVHFSGGRGDATAETTDAASFAVLEPKSDGFRNYRSSVQQLVDQSHMLGLTAPEMAVLVAGMRVLNANADGSQMGVFTETPGVLTNDFFVNLCDMSTTWHKSAQCEHFYEGVDMATGAVKWKGTEVDLVFGSNSELRAIAEYYGEDDSREVFITDFIAAWTKVMNNNFDALWSCE